MKAILKLVFTILSALIVTSCSTNKAITDISEKERAAFNATEGEPVVIANDSIEYEITIIDPGFYTWLNSIAMPRGYYTKQFMKQRNDVYVMNWNQRVLMPTEFNPQLYLFPIDYNPQIDYGYEVNYQLFNYFIYFQRKYNQRLGPFYPRIN